MYFGVGFSFDLDVFGLEVLSHLLIIVHCSVMCNENSAFLKQNLLNDLWELFLRSQYEDEHSCQFSSHR